MRKHPSARGMCQADVISRQRACALGLMRYFLEATDLNPDGSADVIPIEERVLVGVAGMPDECDAVLGDAERLKRPPNV